MMSFHHHLLFVSKLLLVFVIVFYSTTTTPAHATSQLRSSSRTWPSSYSTTTTASSRSAEQQAKPQAAPIVASLGSLSHIQIIRSKPRSQQSNQLFTSLNSMTINATSIRLEWTVFYVVENVQRKRRARRASGVTGTSEDPIAREIQWTITLRQFGADSQNSQTIYGHVQLSNVTEYFNNKTYVAEFNNLTVYTAYELCIATLDTTIVDRIKDVYATRRTECSDRRQTSDLLCKELRTAKSKSFNINNWMIFDYDRQLAMATAVSCLSILSIVLLICCYCTCCRRVRHHRKKTITGSNSGKKRGETLASSKQYQRFSKSSSSAVSSDVQSTSTDYRPDDIVQMVNDDDSNGHSPVSLSNTNDGSTRRAKSHDYNPSSDLFGKNLRTFVRQARRLYMPSKWSTQREKRDASNLSSSTNGTTATSMDDNGSESRLKRPKSWSPSDAQQPQQQWPSLGASPVDSASSASVL